MAAGPWILTNDFRQSLAKGQYDLTATGIYKVGLLTSASNIGPTSTTWAAVTGEVANGFGYLTGGIAVDMGVSGTTSVPVVFLSNPVWTATGGSITGRRAALYKTGGKVLGYCLLDATDVNVTATDGNQISIDSDGVPSPLMTIG